MNKTLLEFIQNSIFNFYRKGISMAEENTKPKKFFYVVFSIVLLVIFFFSIIGNLVLGGMLFVVSMDKIEEMPGAAHYQKKTFLGKGENDILMISVKGVISSEKFLTEGWVTPEQFQTRLLQAGKDPSIKAVILNINSPGGSVTATDKIHRALLQFREKYKKPIVAYFDSVAASGGYYLASACEQIISHPTCITGSIGVIMSYLQMQDLLENKLGIKQMVVKSGAHKDIGSFSRPTTEEEKKILQGIVDEMYERFLTVVQEGRPKLKELKREELLTIADGRIYTGKEAKELGLVDKVGYFEDAIEVACELGRIMKDNYRIVVYQEQKSLIQELLSPALEEKNASFVQKLSENVLTPGLYYLWKVD